MKRIHSACLIQTVHFQLKDGLEQAVAVRAVQEEYAAYKTRLDNNHTPYKILWEKTQPDGSIMIEIKKQYNTTACGTYLD